MKKLIILSSLFLLVITLLPGCQFGLQSVAFTSIQALYAQKTTLDQAEKIIGITLPLPSYLPKGYLIQEVYVQYGSVTLLISDGPIEKKLVIHTDFAGTMQRYELQEKMEMSVRWYSENGIPVRLPVERVTINESYGFLETSDDHNTLWWDWYPDPGKPGMFELVLSANKGISKNELVKIAESVFFNHEPEFYTPQSKPVISDRMYDIKGGEFRYLCIYEDGSLTCIEMKNLLDPVDQHVQILKTGKLDEGELNDLIGFFEVSGFRELKLDNQFPGLLDKDGKIILSDVHYSVSNNFESWGTFVKASNYLSPNGGKTYPDMPYPLNEIYKRLRDIAENNTTEVSRERIF
jgi:hypothetical protein